MYIVVRVSFGLTPFLLMHQLGERPRLRHAPFGFGGSATGGSTNTSAIYMVSNRTELWEAMSLPFTKTIYVNGTIHGNQLDNGELNPRSRF